MARTWRIAAPALFVALSTLPSMQAAVLDLGNNATIMNWGRSFTYTPKQYVRVFSEADVAEVVKNTDKYPSPVRAHGALFSVLNCMWTSGTAVDMAGMKKILGLRTDRGRELLRVEAGVRMIDVHTWLLGKGKQSSFVGDTGNVFAGQGGLAVSKESGLGPSKYTGSNYKAIVGLRYVDHAGESRELNDIDDNVEFNRFKAAEGMLGIVTHVDFIVFPAKLFTYTLCTVHPEDVVRNFADGTYKLSETENYQIPLRTDYALVIKKEVAPAGALESPDWFVKVVAHEIKTRFQQGKLIPDKPLGIPDLTHFAPVSWTTYPGRMVSDYTPIKDTDSRIDFTWTEYPFEKYGEVVTDWLAFVKDFAKENNGWEPTLGAQFFVPRIPEKPSGWLSQSGPGFDKPGYSFMLDPSYSDPNDPTWKKFLGEPLLNFIEKHGGRVGLTQSHFLTAERYYRLPGCKMFPTPPNNRFTNEYYEQFTKPVQSVAKNSARAYRLTGREGGP